MLLRTEPAPVIESAVETAMEDQQLSLSTGSSHSWIAAVMTSPLA
jgi:hypothetical protein